VLASGLSEKDYTSRVASGGRNGPNLMFMEQTVQQAAGLPAAVPQQRRPLLRFTFRVAPPTEAPFDLEIWSEDLGDAADRACGLASMAYGPDTSVSLAIEHVPQPVL
jgi:hypothetical protein